MVILKEKKENQCYNGTSSYIFVARMNDEMITVVDGDEKIKYFFTHTDTDIHTYNVVSLQH